MASPTFSTLPVELRLQIYAEYFALHRGQMDIKPKDTNEERYPSSYLSKRQASMRPSVEKFEPCVQTYLLESSYRRRRLPSLGPMSLLVSCKSVHNEALELYLKSTTFCFMKTDALSNFLDDHDGLLHNVKYVVIDQTGKPGHWEPDELARTLRLLQRLTSLVRLCIYFDTGVPQRRGINVRPFHPQAPGPCTLRNILLRPRLFHSLRPETLFIQDPFLEVGYGRTIQYHAAQTGGERGFWNAMIAMRCEGGPTLALDGLTDTVRDSIRHERGDLTSDRRMSLLRDTITRNYFLALGSSPLIMKPQVKGVYQTEGNASEAKAEFDRRFCRAHGVMVCPCN